MTAMNTIKKLVAILLVLSLATSFLLINTDSTSATTFIIHSYLKSVISDGSGGAFLLIQNFDEESVYIQHVDTLGNSTWQGSGMSATFSYSCDIVYDGQGGVIYVREDNNRIYAQRLDNSGSPMWEDSGIVVYQDTQGREQDVLTDLVVVPDNNGGAVLIWQSCGDGYALYAQKIGSTGEIGWDINGILVSQKNKEKYCSGYLGITCTDDGVGGVIIAWREQHWREQEQIIVETAFVQRVNKQGNLRWGVNGLQLELEYNNLGMMSDENGGVFLIYDNYHDIFFCHVNGTGERVSGVNDIKLDKTAFPYDLQILSDGFGGIFVVREEEYRGWNFLRNDTDLYSQRIDGIGNNLWGEKRVAICTNNGRQYEPMIITDGAGGFIVAWQDYRNDSRCIFAQRVDASGNVLWTKDGVNLGRYYYPYRDFKMVVDGAGGAIIFREEGKSLEPRIFSQVVDNTGAFTEPQTSLYPQGLLRDKQDYEALIGSTTIYYPPQKPMWVWLITAGIGIVIVILVVFLIRRKSSKQS
jgi:hypothetical protein